MQTTFNSRSNNELLMFAYNRQQSLITLDIISYYKLYNFKLMPPKKQEQSQSAPYKPCFILPIFINGHQSSAASALSKPVNIKKNIDTPKIIQILKDKGLQPFIVQGKLNDKGRAFACENLKIICDQFIASLSKPADPKKDTKKDAKKQAKKQEPPPQSVIPPVEIQFQKNCSDFFMLLSVPATPQQLQIVLSKDIKIDIVAVIKQKIKPGSRKPNYQLLNNKRSHEDLSQTLKQTVTNTKIGSQVNKGDDNKINHKHNAKEMIKQINEYRSKISKQNPNKNIVVLQIPFINDLSKPQTNQNMFIRSFFQRVCQLTKQFDQFIQWKSERKLVPMIEPIKQKITKQVQVEDKNDKGKKGGKPSQPIFQTVEEIIQKKYEDFPENIKSDLKPYYLVKNVVQGNKNKVNYKDNESIYKNILQNCLNSLEQQKKVNQEKTQIRSSQKSQVQIIGDTIKNKFELQPINKVTSQSIANKLRNINYPKNISMNNSLYFQYPKMVSQFSFMQLSQKSDKDKQQLKMEFIINKLQNLAKTRSPKIGWSFNDRRYLEKFTKQQLQSIICEQLLHDPEVFTGYLETQGLKLMVMSRTNPPGRVLYHNSIIDWKVLPNFQNWIDHFLKSQQLLAKQEFYDYPFQQAGNLAIKAKNMMPADNTVIRDQMFAIGEKRDNIVQLYKDNNKFGLTKKTLRNGQQIYTYWHDFEDEYRLRVFKTKIHIFGDIKVEDQANENKEEIKIQNIQKVQSSLGVLLERKNNYIVMMDPNPIIYWNHHTQQRLRQFGSLGQIISYKKDGSIHIYSPNGDISILRNGKWKRILQNQLHQNGLVKKLQITQISEGQNIIKIREDQTIFIFDPKENKKIIFPDGTQIFQDAKQRKRQIKNPVGPFIRIFLPRDYNLNTIGHGSAFAYLGFKNILQRSYDGYLFEFIDHQISSHSYTERYELNGKIQTQYIRLIAYKDSSILKINSRSASLVHVSPSKNQLLNQQILNQRWLQAFTTATNHGQGVFDIDLNKGHIENKDSQTNNFIAKVDQRSESHIAVSFITENEDDSFSNFPNGFHIKQQNYFLPPPTNRIAPRIFTINQDGSGVQYLNKDQIDNMSKYTVISEHQGIKSITQYSMQMSPLKSYMPLTFSQPVNLEIFGLPDVLKTSETKQSLIPVQFDDIKHRIIEQISWNSDYKSLNTLEDKMKEQSSQKLNRKSARKERKKTQERLFES